MKRRWFVWMCPILVVCFAYASTDACNLNSVDDLSPLPGECDGQIARAKAIRERFAERARPCSLSQIMLLKEDGTTSCAECFPNSTGLWRIHPPSPSLLAGMHVQVCEAPHPYQGFAEHRCHEPSLSPTSSSYLCRLNQYCTEEGVCKNLKDSPSHSKPCHTGQDCPFGLRCIRHQCKICPEDGEPRGHFTSSAQRTKGATLHSFKCVEGEYVELGAAEQVRGGIPNAHHHHTWSDPFADPSTLFIFLIMTSLSLYAFGYITFILSNGLRLIFKQQLSSISDK
ncbi:hypothetical protein QOT17_022410 [Balamuthia mandrillaris]